MTETPAADRWQLWIDRGGTFTSLVGRRPDGTLLSRKVPTNRRQDGKAALPAAVHAMMGLRGGEAIPADAVGAIRLGTTATLNAVLEGRGVPTVLVVTKGFGDVLALEARRGPDATPCPGLPMTPLHERVIEVNERVDADGRVLAAPILAAVTADLRAAFDAGMRAAAIAFVHASRFPAHEDAVAEAARAVGFTSVAVSHLVSPRHRLATRATLCVAEAALAPLLQVAVKETAAGLGETAPLTLMQSAGRLGEATPIRVVDVLLSGPAGGAAAMAGLAPLEGLESAVGFDMGGTQTTAAYVDGRDSGATRVLGGEPSPTAAMHTVAVGGGSVLRVADGTPRLGPDSAGADPGPACFRAGGPPTVSDCNVLLGRIQPRFFPRLFGESGDRTLDADVVRTAFAELAAEIGDATGDAQRPRDVAEQFLHLTVDAVTEAVRHVTVRRGIDLGHHALHCFGGAAGQIVCLVAEALGMTRVFVHPQAGVLGAYGLGMAETVAARRRALRAALEAGVTGELARHLDEMETETRTQLQRQGFNRQRIAVARWAHLRYEGAHVPLAVGFDVRARMVAAFEAAHRDVFGFTLPGRGLVVEAVSVEATGHPEPIAEPELEPIPGVAALKPLDIVRLYTGSGARQAPIYNRDALLPGDTLEGAAIVADGDTTTVLEPGWRAEVNRHGHLILTRVPKRVRPGDVDPDLDPSLLEVFGNRMRAAAAAMGRTLAATACSAALREGLGQACGVFDDEGRLLAAAPGAAAGLAESLEGGVQAVLNTRDGAFASGEVYVHNVPRNGATAAPEIAAIAPVFAGDDPTPRLFVAVRARHADTGGPTPGSLPTDGGADDGVTLDAALLIADGRLREAEIGEALAAGRWPARNAAVNLGDLMAQAAAVQTGVRALGAMLDEIGPETTRAYAGYLRDAPPEETRRGATTRAQSAAVDIAFGNDTWQHAETLEAGGVVVDAEVLEEACPVLVEACRSNPDGDGLMRRIRFREPMTATLVAAHAAGAEGSAVTAHLERRDGTVVALGGTARVEATAGDVLAVAIANGQSGSR